MNSATNINAPSGDSPVARFHSWGLLAAALAYALLRIALVPAAADQTNAFSHDSAYISIVADQVRAGNGLVNPAHWLVFIQPEKLPEPFHNANPGYLLAAAGVGNALSWSSARSGLLISTLSSTLLLMGVFSLLRQFTKDWRWPALAAILVTLFPANFADSLCIVPDALSTALCVWAIAVAVRKPASTWTLVLAGALLGAAWLVRSSGATFVWPALLWWMFRSYPLGKCLRHAAAALIAFLVVISPWLVYTYRVWGSPLRSDSGYALLQSYSAYHRGITIAQFFRSLDPPPSLGAILRSEPLAFVSYYVHQIPVLAYDFLATASSWSKPFALLLVCVLAIAAIASRRYWRTPELQSSAVLVFSTFAVLNVRAATFEVRYLGPAIVLLVILALMPVRELFVANAPSRERILGAAALLFTILACLQDVSLFRRFTATSEENFELRRDFNAVTQEFAGPILADTPYFFTYFTGRSALTPPLASQQELVGYMNRYGARYLALPTARVSGFYDVDILAPAIRSIKQVGTLTVFERLP